jgi:hypothetical protein
MRFACFTPILSIAFLNLILMIWEFSWKEFENCLFFYSRVEIIKGDDIK